MLTEDFTVTAGGRWYHNERDYGIVQGSFADNPGKPDTSTAYVNLDDEQSSSESGFVGKLSLRYNIDYDKLVYATYSEGFRSGGGNNVKARSIIPTSFDSDFFN